MIVVDASAAIDVLVHARDSVCARRLVRERTWAAPHLIDVEVIQVLRRFVRARKIGQERAQEALADFLAMPLRRYGHTELLRRAYELRGNATAYDAVYLALAEALSIPLVTRDGALARIPRCKAVVEVI